MLIYKVTNTKNGLSYIGQTVRSFEVRKAEHCHAAANISRQKYPTPLHRGISHFGAAAFTWEVLEVCSSIDHLNERERFYIKLLDTMIPHGYNQTLGGAVDGSMSIDVRTRIAESMHEVHKDPVYRARVYPKLKGLTPPNKGKPMSAAQKAKLSKANFVRYSDPTYKNPNVGQRRTDEQKANIRAGQQGKMCSGTAWQAAHGKQFTPEVRAAMSAKKKGKKPAATRQVQCIETGKVYAGLTDAAKDTGAPRQSIWLQIKGKLQSAGGLHFKYLDNSSPKG